MGPFIQPEWPAPPAVRAVSTTRRGGLSEGPHADFNLAEHVDDDPLAVAANRAYLRVLLDLPAEPVWLQQIHGVNVIDAAAPPPRPEGDGSIAKRPGTVCGVLTADCLPVLFCDHAGTRVGAAHAGWRGLAAGVLEAAVDRLGVPGGELLAWLGPAIGPAAFEVGPEVREAFLAGDADCHGDFRATTNGRYLCDLYALARRRLARKGVHAVYGGRYCTFSDAERFYSYRRDAVTGRMASLIWLTA